MLRITQSESAQAAKSYFSQSLSRGDYYMEGQEIAGNWGGRGAEMLGLTGALEREAFLALLDNKRPDGRSLTAKTILKRRPGYDFTFDVPKSVSIIYALGGDERIREAMDRAVTQTMREMEQEMHARVRKNGAFDDRKTGVMIWADFTHLTTRPVELDRGADAALQRSWERLAKFRDKSGRLALPDPHLHRHVYVVNATYDAEEQMWKAGEFMRIKRDASYYQAAYHARLAGELQKIGYEIEPTAKAFEIAGVARSMVEIFSRRTKEIEEKARELGITDDDAKAQLGAMTRRGKVANIQMSELRALWRELLRQDERAAVAAIAIKAVRVGRGVERDSPDAAAGAIRYALGHELERVSEVTERRLLARALMHGVGRVKVPTMHQELARTPGILRADIDGLAHLTTREILAEESALMAYVRSGRGRVAPLASVAGLDTDAGRRAYQFRTPLLQNETKENKEQREAVLHVLGSQDWVVGVVGRAGTGKTTLLHEINAAVAARGKKLIMCAPTAEASRGVLRGEGFHTADTVKRLLVDTAQHAQLRGNVLWIDEAGMVGNRDMLALLQLAKKQGAARVVLAGDPAQIRSVPRGDAFRFLEQNAGLKVARLDKIRRQKSPELRAVVDAISRGNPELGLDLLNKSGGIVEADTRKAWRALATAYADKTLERRGGKTALVISPTHREGEQITEAIRAELKTRGVIAVSEIKIPRTVNLSWTQQERESAANYEPGLVVQFKSHARGFRKSERVRVVEVHSRSGTVFVRKNDGDIAHLPLKHADRFEVYALRELAVAVGDSLKITENCSVPDTRPDRAGHSHRLSNGDVVKVAGVTPAGGLVLEDGKTLPKHFGHLSHGYVITADSAQAKTVDSVFLGIGQESFGALDLRRIYVAISRAREEARIFTDDKRELFRASRRDADRMSATELVGVQRAQAIFRQIQRQGLRNAHEAHARSIPQKTPARLTRLLPTRPAITRERDRMMEYDR